MKHNCDAPICQCDSNPNFKQEVVWYPGETVCPKTPYTKWQKKQFIINKMGNEFRHQDQFYTAHDLETKSV